MSEEERITLAGSADETVGWISAQACGDNLARVAGVDTAKLGLSRLVQMPTLHLSMADVEKAIADTLGDDRAALASYDSQPLVQHLFASSYPPPSTPDAEAWGFRHDGTAKAVVRRATVLS